MNLHSFWLRKRNKWLVSGALVCVGLTICTFVFLRISHPRDIEAYFGMATECHPVWREFAVRRFSAGDSAAEFLRQFPPTQREEFGRYGYYSYYQSSDPDVLHFSGLSVITYDGKLSSASAGGCTWQFKFFTSDDTDFYKQLEAYHQTKRDQRETSKQGKQNP